MKYDYPQTQGGWVKCPENPLIGSKEIGTCFDVHVKRTPAGYRMYFSWRKTHTIACTESADGIHWGEFKVLLKPNPASGWEDIINRNCVVQADDGRLLMWYTGQMAGANFSKIGLAVSTDGGESFHRVQEDPVMVPEYPWERESVMNPFVLLENGVYRMWYAAGESFEPNVICYAESIDGIHWKKALANPVLFHGFQQYDRQRVGGCEVMRRPDGSYIMFYIGYEDINTARVCAAVSPDGLHQWKRLDANPIASPGEGCWDGDACYKPSAIWEPDNNRWMLWYNGRNGSDEFIGLVTHQGENL